MLAAALGAACDRPSPEEPAAEPSPAITLPPAPTDDAVDAPKEDLKQPRHRRVYDVHVHYNPGAAQLAADLLSREGITRMVNLSGGYLGYNDELSLGIAESTAGRMIPFYNIDWDRLEKEGDGFGEAIAKEFEAAVHAGYGGLKISKALGLSVKGLDGKLLPVDSPLLAPIFDKAGELGVPVSIHTGDPKAFFEPVTPANERYKELSLHPSWSFYGAEFPSREELLTRRDRVLARHPRTHFICVHFGNNPEDIAYVEKVLDTYPNAYVDIAARLGEIGRHPPDKVRALFEKHHDRILFGTDSMFYRTRRGYSLTLGSTSEEPLGVEDVDAFFDAHWRFLETRDASMPNPVPIQGEWDIFPIGLDAAVLDDVYVNNAQRIVFDPWDTRQAARTLARGVRQRAREVAAASSGVAVPATPAAGDTQPAPPAPASVPVPAPQPGETP